ncbi:hypothetical protein Scep_022196 [Stephania cephalantha]|uniref:Uncharacterized protein n=1 Tax=Stephania cephalantha TaxID=152367 RepID=A0AAP0F7K2_9MAGN
MFFRSIDKSVIERDVHVKRSDQNHVMERKKLVMMGWVFDEVSCRWFEKAPNNDEGGEGNGGREDGSNDEDEESSEVDPVLILDNDSEVRVIESAEEREYEQRKNFDSVNTPPVEVKSNEGVDFVIEEFIKDQMKQGYGHCDSIEGREAVTPPAVHMDMSTLLKKAAELGKKVETLRKMTKELIDRLDPVVEEFDRALKDWSVCKKWKNKYQPNKHNHG